ncbi:DNA mismatch repair endonuclease MutL [Sutcliffiella sp. NC1]|uniref:DNA mismatch repair endonuclease MutL n=1 Tax=Sutcliffiella sp. NC1 TaxID=3004096 RepID=UPI0022DD5238|nr:DNA mismatch repair endonuclease MutL [Sutcliffiella sp. NC1]WBL13222.1 DNA mismatch repair endonuclease MutL [Sutcliffiella sp. NC1]
MGKIIQLNEQLSNKIAAGEVVERPASVVKELVENAIDANSTIIQIELEEAGLTKIRILDNGDGMEEDDVAKAFYRHATSKIKDENDLFRIRTLGFRGEALPSIASVSIFELTTSTGEEAGTYVKLKGGIVELTEPSNARKGTDITVSHLFYNTPARLKYMKTINTELGNITDIVYRLALAHPEIAFRLSHNGKKIFSTNGNGQTLHVLASIYGMSIAKKMIPIDISSLDFKVTGFLALPEITRASKNYISTIINGRFVKNFVLNRAIQAGYHTLLPIGRHPIVFLQIEMDPLLVDVNVHPAKLEVRISKEDELYELVVEGIKRTFQSKELIPTVTPSKSFSTVKSETEQHSFNFDAAPAVKKEIHLTSQIKEDGNENFLPDYDQPSQFHSDSTIKEEIKWTTNEETDIINEIEVETFSDDRLPAYVQEEERLSRVPTMYPIGQMHGTYIIAQNEKGLYLIDQHAAQERINYEYFYDKLGDVDRSVQHLLVPITIECSPEEYMFLEDNLHLFSECGVFLESFGHQTFIIRSHPVWFPKGEEKEIIEDMMEQILKTKKINVAKLREEAAIMMSCKAAIKANHHLREDEIFSLLETLRKVKDPFTCPHGRPIIIHYSTYELEKMFKRVM